MATSERVESIDVLRGGCTAIMVLANNPGSWDHVYKPLMHAHWNGITFADVGFPLFLFVSGLSMSYGLRSARENPANRRGLLLKLLKRSAILFLIGLFLNGFPFVDLATWHPLSLHSLRIPGVLQRIAVAGLITSVLYINTSWRSLSIAGAMILVTYWLLMCFVPVPGVGPANMEPTTNLGAWLDNYLLPGHLWSHSKVWDPEGILSTLPAIASCIAGVLAGYWMQQEREKYEKLVGFIVAGNLAIGAGLLWDTVFPINKSLWTSSYALCTAGISLQFLAFAHWVVDIKQHKGRWMEPLRAFGTNAIAAYALSQMVGRLLDVIPASADAAGKPVFLKDWLFNSLSFSWVSPLLLSLVFGLICVALTYAPLQAMYKKNIVVKF